MLHFKYALREFRRHPGKYIPLYTQIIVSLILFTFITATFYQAYAFFRQIQSITAHKNMYLTLEQSDIMTIMGELQTEDAEERCKELYDYIQERATIYTNLPVKIISNGLEKELLQVNNSFCSLYEINVQEGRPFTEAELDGNIRENAHIPVLAGSSIASQYPIGTLLHDEVSGAQLSFEVIGIIKEDSYYLNPATDYNIISLNETLLIPWIPIDALNNGYHDINLFSNMQLETDTPEVLDDIIQKSKDLGLFTLSYPSFQEQIGSVEQYYLTVYSRDFAMLGAILLYCIVGSVTMLFQYMKRHIRAFSIHILCGARQGDMIRLMFAQISIPVFIGLFLSALCFRDLVVFGAGALFGILLLAIILILPARFWRRVTISQILKRYD